MTALRVVGYPAHHLPSCTIDRRFPIVMVYIAWHVDFRVNQMRSLVVIAEVHESSFMLCWVNTSDRGLRLFFSGVFYVGNYYCCWE